ncbi:MAG TPA: hypothetical protein VL147_08420, partial [Devosia sp.]|nr:hypothetical protein [Devosia sp.]
MKTTRFDRLHQSAIHGIDRCRMADSMERRYLDLSLPVGQSRRIRIVERPGLWMAPDQLAQLTGRLRTIASRTLDDKDLQYGIFSGDKTRLQS